MCVRCWSSNSQFYGTSSDLLRLTKQTKKKGTCFSAFDTASWTRMTAGRRVHARQKHLVPECSCPPWPGAGGVGLGLNEVVCFFSYCSRHDGPDKPFSKDKRIWFRRVAADCHFYVVLCTLAEKSVSDPGLGFQCPQKVICNLFF